MEKETKLSVKNLKISFRTDGGKVQAVRNISFDLAKGETLAIVGESGSGKSVTSRAILGILANNAIKDGGEILYDGQDLMKISEEQFCKIRGDKIAMIFQDPLSSLNPIMRVGKQMTEAMLIKGKTNQKNCRNDFNGMLACLNKNMDETRGADDPAVKAQDKEFCDKFDKFECKHLELENAFVAAKENAVEALSEIDDVLFHIEKNVTDKLRGEIKDIIKLAAKTSDTYVVCAREQELTALLEELKLLLKESPVKKVRDFVVPIFRRGAEIKDDTDYAAVAVTLGKIKEILTEAVNFDEPNFFYMGYYLTFAGQELPQLPIKEMNAELRKYLDDNFMLEFIRLAKDGIRYSNARSVEDKKAAVKKIDDSRSVFQSEEYDRKQINETVKALVKCVEAAIDRLETVKDNVAYTFGSSLRSAVDLYFDSVKRNIKEEKRFAKQTAAYDKKAASGKTPDWKVADKNLVDLQAVKDGIVALLDRIKGKYEQDIQNSALIDFDARTVGMIDYLKEKASGVAHKVTRGMAKAHALKLMDEVGIPEPRKRFRQYPFEFSGGMRQRIVIAIALSADPDILICDEPTTALDVTIQSQILELINKVKEERQLSVIFITHDLGVVANMADRVAVMYAGKIVEIGTATDIFYAPAHPYTWALLSSMPDLDTKEKLEAIPGTPPNMIYPPKGDAFAERNKYAMQIDFEEQPPMFRISDTHYAATWLLHPNAPKIDLPQAIKSRIERMKKAHGMDGVASDETAAVNVADEATDAPADAQAEEAVKATKAKKPAAKKTAAKKTAAKSETAKKPSAAKSAKAKSEGETKTRATAKSAKVEKDADGTASVAKDAKSGAKKSSAKSGTKSAAKSSANSGAKKASSAKMTDTTAGGEDGN